LASLSTFVWSSPNHVSSRVGDDLVILDLEGAMYYSLDPVGARIFELVKEPTSVGAIVGKVVEEFEVDAHTAGRDVLALVDALLAHGLVEVRAGDAA
jgi:hypothetical protein